MPDQSPGLMPDQSPGLQGTVPVLHPAEPADPTVVDGGDTGMAQAAGARRRWLWPARFATLALVVAVGAAAVGFGLVSRRDAQRSVRAADAWRQQAQQAQAVVAEQELRLQRAEADVARLQQDLAVLTAARDGAVAQAAAVQALLDDTTRRLVEAESRVAALAGTQARAADQAILSR